MDFGEITLRVGDRVWSLRGWPLVVVSALMTAACFYLAFRIAFR